MLPGPEERFLHDVLGSLPVSVRHPQRVPQQRGGMLRLELTDQRLIADPALGGLGPRTALTRHIFVTALRCSRFIARVHVRLARAAQPPAKGGRTSTTAPSRRVTLPGGRLPACSPSTRNEDRARTPSSAGAAGWRASTAASISASVPAARTSSATPAACF